MATLFDGFHQLGFVAGDLDSETIAGMAAVSATAT